MISAFASAPQEKTASICGELAHPAAVSVGTGGHTLCRLIESVRLDELQWSDFQEYREPLFKLYLPGNFDFVWITGNQPTPQARAIIAILQQANMEGLDPQDYDGPRWQQRIDRLSSTQDPVTPEDLAHFDLALTISTLRYLNDLHNGRVSPSRFHFGLKEKNFDAAEYLRSQLLAAASMEAVIKKAEPSLAGYGRTQKALADYLALAQAGEGDLIPAPEFPLKPGDSYTGTAALAERLRRLKDLAPDAVEPAPNFYAEPLVSAIKHFQQRHGLTADGRFTKETYDQLTMPFLRRVTQLQLTLERLRWLPSNLESPLIVVNIPEFRLRTYDDHHATIAMKAIVGEASEHQTPVFADDIEAIVFRPYWNIPESIQKKELVKEIKKHPDYLLRHHMEVVNSRGELVPVAQVDAKILRQLQAGTLMLRQQPGPANALGLVKFVFPNQYSIYMHGTPETGLFARARRDLSHGCIRVENPAALAAWVLRDTPGWTPARIISAMRGSESIEVKLRHSIPILILYGSALVEETGEVRFFNDIYGFDASLQTALEHRRDTDTARKVESLR